MKNAGFVYRRRPLLLAVFALASTLGGACAEDVGSDSSEYNPDLVTDRFQAELNAAATSSSVAVKPTLKCVDKLSSTSYKAHFGYTSGHTSSITIPVGFFNRFYPNPAGRGQPTTFAPGTFADVVQVTFTSSSGVTWILGGGVVSATSSSKLCTTAGTGGAGTGGRGTGGAGTGGKGTGGAGTGGAAGGAGRGGSGGSGGTAGSRTGGSGTGGAGTGGAPQCPSTCDDRNPCTVDICNASTSFQCSYVAAADGITCTDGNACTVGDKCLSGVCTAGAPRICAAADQCHAAGVCDTVSGACSNPSRPDGTGCSDSNACTTGDTCRTGVCTPGVATVCTASDQCHVVGVCAPATGVCSNPAAPDGATCTDGNACTLADACRAGVCVPGAPKVCSALDQCHVAGQCAPATGACSNPPIADGAPCSDGNACTTIDACVAGTCLGGSPKTCTALDQCHVAGVCQPTTGACSNPPVADGTTCDDTNVCSTGDACQAGVCTPAVTLTPTHCSGAACDFCSFDPDTGNCFPATDGCDQIDDAGDRQLCEDLYACFTNPANHCVTLGNPLGCWCGTNDATCFSDNAPPTQANGPCLNQVFAAAKTTDAATIQARFADQDYPLGRAANLTLCRGGYCSAVCGVP